MISRGSLSICRSTFAILPACAGLIWLGGCTDSNADERAQVQDQLAEVQIRLASATAGTIRPGADGYDAAVQELEGVVSSIRGINGGSRGQQGAKELLAATALQDLASMEQQAIDVMLEDINQLRTAVAANAKAALMLNGLADARASIDVSDERARLDEAGANVQRELTAASQQANELGAPISEREQQNQTDRAQVASLRDRAEELYRQADVKGPADGLEDYLEGQRLNREADQLERQISERMIDLDYDYAAEHARISEHVDSLRSQLQSVGATRADLDELTQSFNSDASASRAKSSEMASKANDALNEIQSMMTNQVIPHYQSAVQHLTDAAAQAQAAAGKLDRDAAASARMSRVRIMAALGQLHSLHADALDQQAMLMELLGSHPDMQSVATGASAVAAQRDAAQQNAVDAYNEAKAAVGGSSNAETLALQNNLDAVIAKLTGGTAPAPMSITPPSGDGMPTPGAVTPPGAAAGTPPFATAEELVAFLNNVNGDDPMVVQHMVSVMHAETDDGRALVSFMGALGDLLSAMTDAFGAEALMQGGGGGGMSPAPFESAELIDAQADSGTVRVTSEMGETNEVQLVRIGGAWKISVDDLANTEMGMPVEDMAQAQAIEAKIRELTAAVRSGEISSPDEAFMGLMATFMEGMDFGSEFGGGGPG